MKSHNKNAVTDMLWIFPWILFLLFGVFFLMSAPYTDYLQNNFCSKDYKNWSCMTEWAGGLSAPLAIILTGVNLYYLNKQNSWIAEQSRLTSIDTDLQLAAKLAAEHSALSTHIIRWNLLQDDIALVAKKIFDAKFEETSIDPHLFESISNSLENLAGELSSFPLTSALNDNLLKSHQMIFETVMTIKRSPVVSVPPSMTAYNVLLQEYSDFAFYITKTTAQIMVSITSCQDDLVRFRKDTEASLRSKLIFAQSRK